MTQEQFTALVEREHTPLERCWSIRNFIGSSTGRYDIANAIGAELCMLIAPLVKRSEMANATDKHSSEYWQKVKAYLLDNR